MPAKVFIDTNIVIYALGQASDKAAVVAPLLVGRPTISTQVLTEVTNVVSKRLAMPFAEIRRLLTKLEALCQVELINAKTIRRRVAPQSQCPLGRCCDCQPRWDHQPNFPKPTLRVAPAQQRGESVFFSQSQ